MAPTKSPSTAPDEDPSEFELVPPGCLVLGGGELSRASRDKNMRDVHDAYRIWGICVASLPEPECTAADLAARASFGNEFALVGLSDELSDIAGVRIVREPGHGWPSALLVFDDAPTDEIWNGDILKFRQREPQRNPRYRGPK